MRDTSCPSRNAKDVRVKVAETETEVESGSF